MTRGRSGAATALYERDAELDAVRSCLAEAVAGTGRIVLLHGSPGIGKTRLLDALCAEARGSARVLRGRGGEQERELPLAVVHELFGPVVARADRQEHDRLFAGAAGLAGPLFRHQTNGGPTNVDSAFAVAHGLYWLTANLADASPLVLAVDDAHWTDEATQRWLTYLIPRIGELPVLLALTVRPRELDPASRLAAALATASEIVELEPRPLTLDGTTGVVRSALPTADPEFSAAVHRATGGNPLLVRTLTSALASAGVEPTAAHAGEIEYLGIDRIGRIVLPRVHAIGPDAVNLARAAAVLGESSTIKDAAALAGTDLATAKAATAALAASEVLQARGSLAFSHPLVRSAVLDELAPSDRADLQRRSAALLYERGANPEIVAQHLLAAEPTGEGWPVTALRDAARLAADRGAPESAVTFLQRALSEPPAPAEVAEIFLELGEAAYCARHPRALEWLQSAVDTAQQRPLWVTATLELCRASVALGRRPNADALLKAAPTLDGELSLAVDALLMFDSGWLDPPLRLRPYLPQIPQTPPAGTTPAERMWLAAAAGLEMATCGSAQRAISLAELALAHGALLTETPDSWPVGWCAEALRTSGLPARALVETDAAVEDARRRGSLTSLEFHLTSRAMAHYSLGNLAEAEADVLASYEIAGDQGWRMGAPIRLAWLLNVLRERGEYDRAEQALAEHGGCLSAEPRNLFEAWLLESRGWLHLARGRATEAREDMEACGRVLDQIGAGRTASSTWRAGAAAAYAVLGEVDRAVELATEQVRDAATYGASPWLGSSLRTLGTVSAGESGLTHLHEAVSVLEPAPTKLEYAHALHALGARLRRTGRRTEAKEPLRHALDLAARCGAHALAEAATAELVAAGARPRRHVLTGADALTAAERRVASLAGQGRSNPEIAQALFITRKTVEKHLGNAYLKLAVSSRAELAQVLATVG